ncbi:MAG: hypothetical protein Q7S83_04005 [bacterium]|nr:hypothetical protein [bacterium]
MFKHLNIGTLGKRRGVSTLPTMLLLGGIIIEIAIASAFLTYYFNVTNFAARLSAEALAAARAGADDALIQLVRNRNFAPTPNPYEVSVAGGRTALVTICGEACYGVAGKTQVVSIATALNKKSKVEAILTVTTDGKVTVDSLKEVPLQL